MNLTWLPDNWTSNKISTSFINFTALYYSYELACTTVIKSRSYWHQLIKTYDSLPSLKFPSFMRFSGIVTSPQKQN